MSRNEHDANRHLAASRPGLSCTAWRDCGSAPERLIADILSAARPHYWLALAFTVDGWVIL
jgi:hypothetical protein